MNDGDKALRLADWLESELPADEDGLTVADAAAELRKLHEQVLLLQRTVDEADRRAGAAERRLADEQDTAQRRASWLRRAKADAGYDDRISFDVVWEAALSALRTVRGQGKAT